MVRSIRLGIVRIEVSRTPGLEEDNAVLCLAKTRRPRNHCLLIGTTGMVHQSGKTKPGHPQSADTKHLPTVHRLITKRSRTDQAQHASFSHSQASFMHYLYHMRMRF